MMILHRGGAATVWGARCSPDVGGEREFLHLGGGAEVESVAVAAEAERLHDSVRDIHFDILWTRAAS